MGYLQFAKSRGPFSIALFLVGSGVLASGTPQAASSGQEEGSQPKAFALASPAFNTGPTTLVIDPVLRTKLETLADGLHKEIVLCLSGIVTGEVARAVDFTMPTPVESSPRSSAFNPCPKETLAIWHNHPLSEILDSEAGRPQVRAHPPPLSDARALCSLSGKDIETLARQGHPFAVVAVDRETWCWWTLAQIRLDDRLQRPLAYPVPGQVSWARSGPATSPSP